MGQCLRRPPPPVTDVLSLPQEHFKWLSGILDETRKQLWGADEGDEENQKPAEEQSSAEDAAAEPGPYLLPRTPSMKRRRKETDQGRLAALNASLLDTSANTRSRRAASRVRPHRLCSHTYSMAGSLEH